MFLEVKEKRFSGARIIQKKSKHVSDEIEYPVMAGREPNRKLAFHSFLNDITERNKIFAVFFSRTQEFFFLGIRSIK